MDLSQKQKNLAFVIMNRNIDDLSMTNHFISIMHFLLLEDDLRQKALLFMDLGFPSHSLEITVKNYNADLLHLVSDHIAQFGEIFLLLSFNKC